MTVKEKYVMDAEKGICEEVDDTIQKLKRFSQNKDLEESWVMYMFLKVLNREVNKLNKGGD